MLVFQGEKMKGRIPTVRSATSPADAPQAKATPSGHLVATTAPEYNDLITQCLVRPLPRPCPAPCPTDTPSATPPPRPSAGERLYPWPPHRPTPRGHGRVYPWTPGIRTPASGCPGPRRGWAPSPTPGLWTLTRCRWTARRRRGPPSSR